MSYRLLRPLLFRLPPEQAQTVAVAVLKLRNRFCGGAAGHTWRPASHAVRPPPRPLDYFGLQFPNRIGLAAGFDKSARYLDTIGALGFGFIEVGTVTPRPQPGNAPPNLFRLVADEALINRMGFNSDGVEAVVRRLGARRYAGICGVNIGKNAATPLAQAAQDYLTCLRAVACVADYVTVNVSSPNTPGLRDLQSPAVLRNLLALLCDARQSLSAVHGKRVPLLLKIAPDLDEPDLDAICAALLNSTFDGVVATNTTTSRPQPLRSRQAAESGGLSGRPLHGLSVRVVRGLRARLGPAFPIIGVGGIHDAAAARSTLAAGADLLQIYTGLVYSGPQLVRQLLESSPRS